MTADIISFNKHLSNEIDQAIAKIDAGFDKKAYETLLKATMVQIMAFNKKRVGEIQRFLISDYSKKQSIQKDSELYQSLSLQEKAVSARYSRFETMRTKGRGVPVLLGSKQVKIIDDYIIKFRENTHVTSNNPYIFAKYESTYDCCKCVREFAHASCSNPELISGTKLRKHLATFTQTLQLTDSEMQMIADFMGHNITINQSFYKMPDEVLHLAKMSKLLIALEEGSISQFFGKTFDQIDVTSTSILPNITVREDGQEDEHGF